MKTSIDLIKKPCCEDFIMAKKKKKEDREDPDDGGEADGGSSVRHYTALGFCIYIPVCIYIPRPPPSSPSPLIFNKLYNFFASSFFWFWQRIHAANNATVNDGAQ